MTNPYLSPFILFTSYKMTTKEQLIEKYNERLSDPRVSVTASSCLREFLKDLQSLQEPIKDICPECNSDDVVKKCGECWEVWY